MSQRNGGRTGSFKLRSLNAFNTSVAVPASGNTQLLSLEVDSLERIFVTFQVSSNALDAFIIKAKPTEDAPLVTLYSSTSDYNDSVGLLVGTSGDLSTQAVGTGWFIMDVVGLDTVVIEASGNGASVVSIYAGGQ